MSGGPTSSASPAAAPGDRSGGPLATVGGRPAEAVIRPTGVEDVREALAEAERDGLGVVPMGAGTDPGCEPPGRPFVLLSTLALAGIQEYEPEDLTVTAAAGTLVGELAAELSSRRQWLPVDPPHVRRRTFGGLVATGAGGPLSTAYGGPRDHVLGLTVVTGDGRVLRLGGKVMKNVAGFDLVKLMVGSRGTLGVIVSATVRLFPRAEEDRALVVSAASAADLLAAARAVATAPLVPASAVLLSPARSGGAALVVRLQGSRAGVEADERTLASAIGAEPAVLTGSAARELQDTVADHAASGDLVVRATTLPASLPGALAAIADALPGAELAVDVLAGRVRASAAAEGAEADALTALRRRLEEAGGSLALERAPTRVLEAVPAYGGAGRAGAIASALRSRFDPRGVLSPGRFVR